MSTYIEITTDAHWSTDYDGNVTDQIADAIDLASDQDKVTWITENGKRIAAIVPVDVAERGVF
jgi:hypothetical protein